jgi:ParB family chromosome partitioning protein
VAKLSNALGKGLGALIPKEAYNPVAETKSEDKFVEDDGQVSGRTALIELELVEPNPMQPRIEFDADALEDLKNSIVEKGVIQPITVRRKPGGTGYELIAGERRVRASIEAGKKKIPAYILNVDTDGEMLEMALIENVQRENLNPIETALGYQRLIDECSLTQEEVAQKVGKDRSTVTNFLRLLRLPAQIQASLRSKEITMGHARAMIGLDSEERQMQVFELVTGHALSVRKTEEMIKRLEAGEVLNLADPFAPPPQQPVVVEPEPEPAPARRPPPPRDPELDEWENKLRHLLGTQVRIAMRTDGGSISIDFWSGDELDRLLELLATVRS